MACGRTARLRHGVACQPLPGCRRLHCPPLPARQRQNLAAVAFGGASDPSLLTLPVFPLNNVLHPTQEGMLKVYEPRYLEMYRDMRQAQPGGQGAQFIHVLAAKAAPPALLEDSVGGLPRIACCAEVETIQEHDDGSLTVTYKGVRRVQLLLMQQSAPYGTAAAEWFDDEPVGALDPTVDALEREAAKLLQQIQNLSAMVAPGSSLPKAVMEYRAPATRKVTSYDALKAAGHAAAGHIEMWRRHGSVYKSAPREAAAPPDPYAAITEQLGKARRQELYSFAVAQLLVMGTPERAALMLSQDTGARLNFVLAALRPYMLELQAKAALMRSLQ